MTGEAFLQVSTRIGFGLLIVAVILTFIRLARGPSLPDRVLALDAMTLTIVSFCALAAIRTAERAYLDIAAVLALVGFLSTVALARFAERQVARRDDEDEQA